jgi:homoserine O-succinyltransferase
MPLVAHNALPTFDYLDKRGETVLSLDHALRQDIRELHIGFLNMMPDSALLATERQFMRLIGSSNQIVQLFVHPFTITGLDRNTEIQAYIDRHYTPFERLQEDGLDALIITGANLSHPVLEYSKIWGPLSKIIDWASEYVTSILCSCLASHAIVKQLYGIDRIHLSQKRWGVYPHRVTQFNHPLLRDINTRFDVPHSRYNEITREQWEQAELPVLVESEQAGVHMAASPDQFRIVYLQGHPEYDYKSLLKEYKREIKRYFSNSREDYPPNPENYFTKSAVEIVNDYREKVECARDRGSAFPVFPESELQPLLDNTWGDTGKAVFNNWLGLVYQLTHVERRKLFMDGIDPQNPLGIRSD